MKTIAAAAIIAFATITAACDDAGSTAQGDANPTTSPDASSAATADAGTMDTGRNEDGMNPRPFDGDSILDALLAEGGDTRPPPAGDGGTTMIRPDAEPPSNDFKHPEVISRLTAVPQNVVFIIREPSGPIEGQSYKGKIGAARGYIPFDQMCTKKNRLTMAFVWDSAQWKPISLSLPVSALRFASTMDLAMAGISRLSGYVTIDTWADKYDALKSLDTMIDITNKGAVDDNNCQPLPPSP